MNITLKIKSITNVGTAVVFIKLYNIWYSNARDKNVDNSIHIYAK